MKRQSKTILLVEDDANDRALLERAFRSVGVTCPIRTVAGADEALAYIRGEGVYGRREEFEFPSFIIADLKMCHGDGFALLQVMAEHPEWCVVPVVIFSSSEDADDIKTAYELGAKSFIVKPSALESLKNFAKTFYAYWSMCEVPEIDVNGRPLPTETRGKLSERLSCPDPSFRPEV